LIEDLEDQRAAIHDLHAQRLFEVLHLRRRQIVVEDHQIGVLGPHLRGDFCGFAAADEHGGLGRRPPLDRGADDARSRRGRELRELLEMLFDRESRLRPESETDEIRPANVRSGRVRGGTQWVAAWCIS
jgi:hypothetical protein